MARPGKLLLKRKVASARNDIDRALSNIAYLHQQFNPVHPKHGQLLEGIAKGLILQKQLLERFWEIAWGSEPIDWDTYVGDGSRRGKDG